MQTILAIYIIGIVITFLFDYDGDSFSETVAEAVLWPIDFIKVLIKTFISKINNWKD